MTMLISVMNPKGGVAKTTTTITLASALSETFSVAIVDMDPQESVKTALGSREDMKLYTAKRLAHITDLPNNAKAAAFDFIFIDTPASMNKKQIQTVADVSSFVVVPCKASRLDLEPSLRFIDTYLIPNKVRFKVLLSQVQANSSYVETVRNELLEQRVPLFKPFARQYQAYAYASDAAKSIFDLGYQAASAQNDYRRIANELLEDLQPLDIGHKLDKRVGR